MNINTFVKLLTQTDLDGKYCYVYLQLLSSSPEDYAAEPLMK